MELVVNTHTATVHSTRGGRSSGETSPERRDRDPRTDPGEKIAECGALLGVPGEHLTVVAEERLGEREATTRCGRCFRGEGGY